MSSKRKPRNTKRSKAANKKTGLIARFGQWAAKLLLLLLLFVLLAVTSLRWIDPLTSSVIIQQNIKSLTSGGPLVEYHWVDWEDMSKQLPLAVVSSEDQRFPDHRGIDFTELEKAIDGGGQRGASTITQQVAKNMFLWQGRSYLRKAIEAGLSLYIDRVWGKRRVLEIYLNIAFFGDNLYGVGSACAAYFDKPASRVNRYEAARLAAVLPNPQRFSVTNSSDYTMSRQQWILGQMQQLGGIQYIENL